MKTISFYSYKGGVGRSMALVEMAKKLSKEGFSVFVIDFDLEAPGLTYKFEQEIKGTQVLEKQGLVDYLHAFITSVKADQPEVPKDFEGFYDELKIKDGKAKVHLMTAGQFLTADYWDKLNEIEWNELFNKGKRLGTPLLLDLKGRIEKELNPDYLLIDSRTGITPIATITLKLLADRCAVFAVNNSENISGVSIVLKGLAEMDAKIRPSLHFVLSRIPYPDNKEADQKKKENLVDTVKSTLKKGLGEKVLESVSFNIIHHEREMGFGEVSRILLESSEATPLTHDYLRLFKDLFGNEFDKKKGKEVEERISVADFLMGIFQELDLEKRIALYKPAVKRFPREEIFYTLRGIDYARMGKDELAFHDFKRAVELNPNDELTLNNLANVYKRLENYELALDSIERALVVDPNDSFSYGTKAEIFLKKGDKNLFYRTLRKALDLGYSLSEAIEKEKEYLLVKDEPEFQALLEKSKKNDR